MDRRRIGELEVSVLGLGGNNFGTDFFGPGRDRRQTQEIIDTALDRGINFIDTAEEYSITVAFGSGRSEELIGAALGSRRDQVVIATKFSVEDVDRPKERGAKRIERALEGSLRRLGTDYVDLYQQHTPDPRTPIEEILTALDNLTRAGKVREIGCSNFSGAQIDEAAAVAAAGSLTPFATAQNRYSLLNAADPPAVEGEGTSVGESEEEGVAEALAKRPSGFVEACDRHEMKLIPFFPLASGLLTGKYSRGAESSADGRLRSGTAVSRTLAESELSASNLELVARLEAFAQERGHSILELALSWLTSQPRIATVIAGATHPDQIRSNVEASSWRLSADDHAAVKRIVSDGTGDD